MNKIFPLLFLISTCFFSLRIQAEMTDNTQTKPKIMIMMSSHASKPKGELLKNLAKDLPFTLVNFNTRGKSEDEIKTQWQSAKLIMLDGINPTLSKFMFSKYESYLTAYPNVPVISLGDLTNEKTNQGLTADQQTTLGQYYNNAGQKNFANMMEYISQKILSTTPLATIPKPIIVPSTGLYHDEFTTKLTSDEEAFFTWLAPQKNIPVIAIAIHRNIVDYEQKQVVNAIIQGLEKKGAKAFGFYFDDNTKDDYTYTDLLLDEQNNSRVNLLINYRSLHYVEKRRGEFEALGVPVLHALNYNAGDEKAFDQDHAGISPSLTPFFLVIPEDTGSTDPTMIAAKKNGAKVVMKAQLNALVERAYNHASLAKTPNKNKKVATFIWNYPPGEKNIGAAFLDVPSSIEQITKEMKKEGYNVDIKSAEYLIESAGKLLRPFYRGEDIHGLIEQDLADYLPLSTYKAWFSQLPDSVKKPITERWGTPEENSLLTEYNGEQAFVIPRLNLGNLIVLPQGMRGKNSNEHSALYHNTKTPINHAYMAFYLYARDIFGANAFIHLGTHGSQEWLTGKERGLSVYDAPNLAIGNLPVFYPYIIDNVGEAMQAKRRGRATIISHLTPGFAKAGLYTEVAKLNELISNYMMLEQGQTKQNTQEKIINLATKLNILADLQLNAETVANNFPKQISTLQDHLNELAQQSQPLGVHTFGLLPKSAHLYTTILQMLGEEFSQRAKQYEQDNNLALPATKQRDERKVKQLEALAGYQLLKVYFAGTNTNKTLPDLSAQLKVDLAQAKTYWDNFQQMPETENLLRALNGEYINVSHGGDPIRNPDVVPTGRNLIGFNPAKVPSKEAYQAGVTLMDKTIENYYAKHGKYPEKLAFSLWSLETMRHQGALEAQILHALGLKPKWNQQGNIIGTEVIDYKTLGRPRIDVTITATGLYRDAFPNVMLWLAKAIDKVAKIKEDNNFVYRHTKALKEQLLAAGKTKEDANYLSSIRIFSNETGNYGTGLAGASLASNTWEDDSKLADLYLKRMGYAFGSDEKRWSENVADSELYSKVLSGTDAVIFSRSTNLYALMTNDDPFQYFGGIGLAVRHLDGETPEMYVSNLRRKDNIKAQTMEHFLNQEMRSRYFHPRWIQAMQESGYAGATVILDRMNNMWGWEVMTPEAVRDDQWQEFFEVYIEDKYNLDMREFFQKNNAHALAQIIERMLEAERKGYWKTDEKTIKTMVKTYAELAKEFDVITDNNKFNDNLKAQAAGFGLSAQLPDSMQPQATTERVKTQSAAIEKIEGQKLEEQHTEVKSIDEDYTWLSLLLLVFFAGFVSNFITTKPKISKVVALKKAA
ncbi:MAG: cobaltochelatase subunit CobN [Litorilituus sp.]|nr:cobaltochelatase subunit CobN [Litorilituus sp.]